MNVFILQFVKAAAKSSDQIKDGEWPVSNEIEYFNEIDSRLRGNDKVGRIENEQVGLGFVGILGDSLPREEHARAAEEALLFAQNEVGEKKWDMVILDEVNNAVALGLILPEKVLQFVDFAKLHCEHIILTGRDAHPDFVAHADLVTEMNDLKHPFTEGKKARRGLEY